MAVSEVATGKCKAASGASRGRKIAMVVFAFALSPLTWAQVIADRSAPGNQQPTILTTASGVPQVNIQSPSAGGVSRNTYSQFDVGSKGVILNNSRTDTTTVIGGYVQGNSWLATGSARVILNEVNSSSASQIKGYIEVAGQRAEVIIANPAGIAVNGGGFLNASAVTLTTGTAVMNAGSLESYRVRGGSVTIEGTGLDTSTADYTNILTRAVQVNAGIWAKDLKVITGSNDISASNATTPAVTSTTAGSGTAPAFALDVAALGGMYAGKIHLIGTEAGLGVRNAGTLAASAGDVILSNDGWLSNSGSMAGTGDLNVQTTGALTNNGVLQAGATLKINAQNIDNTAGASMVASANQIVATGNLTNRGLIDSGNATTDSQSRITATTVNNIGTGTIFGDNLGIQATTLNNEAESTNGIVKGATIGARSSLNIGVQTLNNTDKGLDTPANPSQNISATPSVNILSLGDIAIGGSLNATGQAQGAAVSVNNSSATIQAARDISISAAALNNTDAHFASENQTTTTAVSETIGTQADGYYVNVSQRVVSGPVVTSTLPGTISAGGNLTVDATSIDNSNSRMLAGGTVTIPGAVTVNNAGVTATKTTTTTGTAYTLQWDRSCQVLVKGSCLSWGPWYSYWQPSAYSSTVNETVTVGAGVKTNGAANAGGAVPGATTPNSSLYQINTSPSATYVVETNPSFTNYRTWLGSDYMLRSVALDPTVTQKRLGDGFYEQRLLNEQVAQLTGRRFLGDYTSDEQQYRALMNAGVSYAQQFNLRPGIALTAEQIARLTSDIVWLQQEKVTLPNGTTTLALVPHIYLLPRTGDLDVSGGLISGDALHITSSGTATNSGTLLGRRLVQINAQTIDNLGGAIQGEVVRLTATQDINNTGGTVAATKELNLAAGRDINSSSTVTSATSTAGASTITNTTLDRVAGLYVNGDAGVLLASAGRDLNLVASRVINSAQNSQTVLSAQNDVNIATVQTSQTNNLERDSGNFRRSTSTSEVGSTIQSGGTLQVEAGKNITARAADVRVAGNASLHAGNNIILQAGQSTTNVDQMASASGSDLLTTSSIQTRTQSSSATAQTNTLNAKNLSVVADQNLVSVGTEFKGTDSVYVEGKDTTTLYAATNTQQSTTTTQTTTTLGAIGGVLGNGFKLEDKTSTDSKAQSTSIGTRLISTEKVEIGVGNKTTLQGTDVQAKEIVFTKTDPTKTGELILAGSTDTTQTSHTEKSETAGLYQEQKGKGSTTQTLNQTTLKGNVTFDAGLKITAQIPQGDLKTQVQSLTSQNNGAGLEYLDTLSNNPNVKWDKVALAHDQWSYDQAGLTPAGAALLSIAVAAATGGVGAGLTGTTGVLGTAMSAGFTSLASQAAVAMVNNGGDISKTLDQLGKEESIKGLLTTMVTAGALQGLNSTMGWQNIGASSSFSDQLLKNVTNNVASSAIDAAMNGKPFDEKSLSTALTSALITTGMAQGANAIGDARADNTLNGFTQKLAHAVLGCAGGAASGGGCASGAVGAVVGEMAAEYLTDKITQGDPTRELTDKERADVVSFAKVIAATSGVVAGGGGNNAAAVNTAATTGANAAENNYLTHAQALAKKAALEKAKTEQEKQAITASYDKLDVQQKNEAASCLLKNQCTSVFEKSSLEATLKDLNAACAAPRLCTPDEQKSITELKDFYAEREAIKPDTTIEEFLLTNKAVTAALSVAKEVVTRLATETVTQVAKPLGVVSDFSGNPVTVLEATSTYAFKTETNIGATGANLENSAAQFVKDEAGKDFIGVFASKTGNNNGLDLVYAKMVNGQPQLVIGEAKAGDSALTALGENQANTLRRNLEVVRSSINDIANDDIRRTLLIQLDQKTYQVELYTSVGNAAKAASRVDDVLINRMGQPVSRIVTFGKN